MNLQRLRSPAKGTSNCVTLAVHAPVAGSHAMRADARAEVSHEHRLVDLGLSRRGRCTRRRRASRRNSRAPVAQRIEQWFPKPCAQVRFLAGVPLVPGTEGQGIPEGRSSPRTRRIARPPVTGLSAGPRCCRGLSTRSRRQPLARRGERPPRTSGRPGGRNQWTHHCPTTGALRPRTKTQYTNRLQQGARVLWQRSRRAKRHQRLLAREPALPELRIYCDPLSLMR